MFTVKEVVKSNLCIGCGLCTADSKTQGTIYSKINGCHIPKNFEIPEDSIANYACPGKGYDIISEAEGIFPSTNYDVELGHYNFFAATRALDDSILENASSGGILTSILLYLLSQKIVEKVSVTKFVCDESGVSTKTFLTSKPSDVISSQGSKYCPVNFENLLKELGSFKGKVAIVGTPCVIAGIRKIKNREPSLFKADIKLTIANFCGGFKSFNNISRLAEIHEVDINNLKDFRFRGGGQPGSLRFVAKDGTMASTPYPKYVGLTGQSKMHRCHLCVDATGELADIACGDAWIPKFENDNYPWSIVLTRSEKGLEVVKAMKTKHVIAFSEITIEELKLSQSFNLKSKKIRQTARMRLYKILGYKLPVFDGGYYKKDSGISTEIKVYTKHKIKLLLEKMKLYKAIYAQSKKRGS